MAQGGRTTGRRGGWRQWTEGEARAALEEFGRSGESEARFARSRGISTQRIRYWKKRLAEAPAVPAFVPVHVPVAEAPMVAERIEIVVGSVTVRVREDLDVEFVARLVEALAGRGRAC